MTVILFERLGVAAWEKTEREKIRGNEIMIRTVNEKSDPIICELYINGYTIKIPGIAKLDMSVLSGVTHDVSVRYKEVTYRVGLLSAVGAYAIPTADQDHEICIKSALAAEREARITLQFEERLKKLERAYLGSNITHLNN